MWPVRNLVKTVMSIHIAVLAVFRDIYLIMEAVFPNALLNHFMMEVAVDLVVSCARIVIKAHKIVFLAPTKNF